MKKNKNISFIVMLSFIGVLGFLNSCVDDTKLLNMPYLFRPINFSATMNSTLVTISWAKVDSAVSYTLEVAPDSADFVIPQYRVTLDSLSYTKELAGNTTYYARIRANAADSTKNSKFNATLTFKTPKENIFVGYGTKNNTGNTYSAYMTAANTLNIKWKPGANVTHLILTGNVRDSVDISPAEAATGEKTVSGLGKSNWTVEIYNGKILRGTTIGVIEGDIILSSGGDISAALTSASSGQVILLTGGQNYTIGNAEYKFSKSVKIRSTSASSRSVVSMTALVGTAPTTTSAMMSVIAASAIDSLVFENIDFTGYCDNTLTSTKIGYLFSNKTACTVENIKFTNCNIHNFGNTPMRVSGATGQVFQNLSFNGCLINEIGYSSTYAIVNSNSNDLINNISFNNCSVYNFKGSLILRQNNSFNAINITNCNINQGMQDAASTRFLIDANSSTGTSITIKNSIFGQSGGSAVDVKGAAGIRTTATLTVTGSYYTSDFIDETAVGTLNYSFKSKMTFYSGKSTDLWNNPLGGDFSLKDTNFAGKGTAGDLRW